MIVKDETDVIRRCLDSVKPMIDYWVIVDTGSSDGTQQMIKEYLKDIPGELHERPWINFEHNRNEALKLATGKGDYLLLIDADEYYIYEKNFKLPILDKDYYFITIIDPNFKYAKKSLINNHLAWEWKGVLHEQLMPNPLSAERSSGTIQNVTNIYTTEGARSKDPQKYQKDAKILEEALKNDPNNSRYVFYLACSYRDCNQNLLALKNYEKRSLMGGWDEEVFESLLQIAHLNEKIGADQKTVVSSYQRAFKFRPSRVEPLYFLAAYLRKKEDFDLAYQVATLGMTVANSKDILFVQQWIYDYGMALELSACAYWVGRYEECQKICLELLKNDRISPQHRAIIQNNLDWANKNLLNKICNEPV